MTDVGQHEVAQTPTRTNGVLAAALVPHVTLGTIRLVELASRFVPGMAAAPAPYDVAANASVAWRRNPNGFSYAVKADVKVGPPGKPDEHFWVCSAVVELIYLVEESQKFSDDQAIAFGNTSGLIAGWPYVRETVQSTSVRFGLAPITVGVIQVGLPAIESSPTDD